MLKIDLAYYSTPGFDFFYKFFIKHTILYIMVRYIGNR